MYRITPQTYAESCVIRLFSVQRSSMEL